MFRIGPNTGANRGWKDYKKGSQLKRWQSGAKYNQEEKNAKAEMKKEIRKAKKKGR